MHPFVHLDFVALRHTVFVLFLWCLLGVASQLGHRLFFVPSESQAPVVAFVQSAEFLFEILLPSCGWPTWFRLHRPSGQRKKSELGGLTTSGVRGLHAPEKGLSALWSLVSVDGGLGELVIRASTSVRSGLSLLWSLVAVSVRL